MQKNKVVTILLLTAVIILSIVNVVSYNRLNNHKVDSKEKFMIRKIQAKEFKEIEIGFNCLNTDLSLTDRDGHNFNIMDIETPALVFYFNNEGCKSCNANYIETEFDRIKRLTNGKENIKIIILSNFKKFREFYSLSLRFGEDNQINCYNLKNNLFIDNPTIATDLFYFLLNDNHSISSVFLPDYFFEENNTKYFNLVIQKIDNL